MTGLCKSSSIITGIDFSVFNNWNISYALLAMNDERVEHARLKERII
jgi:hypothetical protein